MSKKTIYNPIDQEYLHKLKVPTPARIFRRQIKTDSAHNVEYTMLVKEINLQSD